MLHEWTKGTGDSGKTTIVKQMQLHRGGGFGSDLSKYKKTINVNILDCLKAIITYINHRQWKYGMATNQVHSFPLFVGCLCWNTLLLAKSRPMSRRLRFLHHQPSALLQRTHPLHAIILNPRPNYRQTRSRATRRFIHTLLCSLVSRLIIPSLLFSGNSKTGTGPSIGFTPFLCSTASLTIRIAY
jgi:hypothetical protein